MKRTTVIASSAVIASVLLGAGVAQGAILLGPGRAMDINDAGQVVGTAEGYAFLWSQTTGMSYLFPGIAYGINEAGQVVGGSHDGPAFLWDPVTGITELGPGIATAINNNGVVLISAGIGMGSSPVYLWSAETGRIAAGFNGTALDINDSGQIVGMTIDEAYMWDPVEGMTLLGKPDGVWGSRAWRINESGQVVVSPFGGVSEYRGSYLWDPLTGITQIPFLGDTDHNEAVGLNDAGVVAGLLDGGTTGRNAYIWDSVNGIQALDGTGCAALSINNNGQAVGFAERQAGDYIAVWGFDGPGPSPVPEPAALAVWATLGGLGLIAARRRSLD